METIAVYWEETIRTYGIQVEKNLCLVQTDVLPPKVDALGQLLVELGEDGTKPRLILAHQFEAKQLRISMVFQEKFKNRLVQFTTRPAAEDVSSSFVMDCPVEMLNFHGPHFGDRYGIADMAATALKIKDIRYMAMGCSAASVHLIFPENVGDRAKKALESVFNTP
jgi:aspartokinase